MSGAIIRNKYTMTFVLHGVRHIFLFMTRYGEQSMPEISAFLIKRGLFKTRLWHLMKKLAVKRLIMLLLIGIIRLAEDLFLLRPRQALYLLLVLAGFPMKLHQKMFCLPHHLGAID